MYRSREADDYAYLGPTTMIWMPSAMKLSQGVCRLLGMSGIVEGFLILVASETPPSTSRVKL
jgi:hypothetical protein